MNKQILTAAALLLGGLIVGAAVEHMRLTADMPEPMPTEPEIVHHVRKVVATDAVDASAHAAQVAALQEQLKELQNELAKMRSARVEAATVQLEDSAETDEPRSERESRRRESWADRMERMKTEEPERYAEMMKQREDFIARMEQRKQSKRDFLSSINTASMSPEQRAGHERLIALNERVNQIGELMFSGEEQNRDELRREMFDAVGEMRELQDQARIYLLEQTAQAAGYHGDQTALFIEHIENIIDHTNMQGPAGMRGGFGRR